MAEIKCPNCGTLISLQQSDLDSIVRQVRDEEFTRELNERVDLLKAEKGQALRAAKARADAELLKARADSKAELLKQKSAAQLELQKQKADAETQLQKEKSEAAAKLQREKSEAAAQLEAERVKAKDAFNEAMALRDEEIAKLRATLDAQEQTYEAKKNLAVSEAVASIEKERDSLQSSLQVKEARWAEKEAALNEQHTKDMREKDEFISYQKDEIERIKDMKARLSTKMVGETLEQHCRYEFDRIRAMAFPNAYFEKDNDAVEGTKGDFVFRDFDDDGNEVISIMFEMKNEEDTASAKKRNEHHFAKLDKDRSKKNCEYAILVSLLEPESELYNEGIVDVSHRYPKMYVVRPQFFIPIISLLRNAALSTMESKRELALIRQENLDITNFERDLDTFKTGFFKNFGDASARFEDAVKAIDKAIGDLQKAKDKLLVSEKHLKAANNKLDDLTIKKLTRKNPTMRERFEALHDGGEIEVEVKVED